MKTKHIPGILFLYHRLPIPDARTIEEHIFAFEKYSQFDIYYVNTNYPFPSHLHRCTFDAIVLHYSIFGGDRYLIADEYIDYVARSHDYKIAFFQDEYYFCQKRFDFINAAGIDAVWTCLREEYWDQVYLKYTNVKHLHRTLTGFVDDDLRDNTRSHAKPWDERNIDVGYRGRRLPAYLGAGGQEKINIAEGFLKYASDRRLKLDISCDEKDRYYGADWYRFLGDCKFTLGVESGATLFDLDGEAYQAFLNHKKHGNPVGVQDLGHDILTRWDNNIPIRTVSPRNFEAAALGSCQILFEGDYEGILEPMRHYIPLKKNFSNMDEVLEIMGNRQVVSTIIKRCQTDLITSEKYTYKAFIAAFDAALKKQGIITTSRGGNDAWRHRVGLALPMYLNYPGAYLASKIMYGNIPQRDLLIRMLKPFMGPLFGLIKVAVSRDSKRWR